MTCPSYASSHEFSCVSSFEFLSYEIMRNIKSSFNKSDFWTTTLSCKSVNLPGYRLMQLTSSKRCHSGLRIRFPNYSVAPVSIIVSHLVGRFNTRDLVKSDGDVQRFSSNHV